MVWCPMILAQHVIVRRVVGRPPDRGDARRHPPALRGHAHGGRRLGTPSRVARASVFVTALGYVALRLLGVPPDDPLAADGPALAPRPAGRRPGHPDVGQVLAGAARPLRLSRGQPLPAGAVPAPPLAARPPAPLLLPHPLHLSRHELPLRPTGARGARPDHGGALPGALRAAARARRLRRAPPRRVGDRSLRPSRVARAPADGSPRAATSTCAPGALRRRALEHAFARILYEQRQTGYQALSPVNGLLNCLAIWARDPAHPDLTASLAGLEAWRWEDPEAGIRYAGARSHAWDTAFAAQASGHARCRPQRRPPPCAAPTASWRRPSSRTSCPILEQPTATRSRAAGASRTARTAGR